MARLKVKYTEEVAPALFKKFGYKSTMQIPKIDKVSKSKNANFGYDAAHDTFGDMIENGIVDPTKVCRSALENAASVSSMVLTTESLVADLPEKAAPAAPAAPDMGGMY